MGKSKDIVNEHPCCSAAIIRNKGKRAAGLARLANRMRIILSFITKLQRRYHNHQIIIIISLRDYSDVT